MLTMSSVRAYKMWRSPRNGICEALQTCEVFASPIKWRHKCDNDCNDDDNDYYYYEDDDDVGMIQQLMHGQSFHQWATVECWHAVLSIRTKSISWVCIDYHVYAHTYLI